MGDLQALGLRPQAQGLGPKGVTILVAAVRAVAALTEKNATRRGTAHGTTNRTLTILIVTTGHCVCSTLVRKHECRT